MEDGPFAIRSSKGGFSLAFPTIIVVQYVPLTAPRVLLPALQGSFVAACNGGLPSEISP